MWTKTWEWECQSTEACNMAWASLLVVVDEKKMNAITAVSGSGPAYVYLFLECLTNAAKSLGFNQRESEKLRHPKQYLHLL